MQDEKIEFADRDELGCRQSRCPLSLVDISAHNEGGSNAAKAVDHLGVSDVAGVDDHIRAAQRVDSLGPQ